MLSENDFQACTYKATIDSSSATLLDIVMEAEGKNNDNESIDWLATIKEDKFEGTVKITDKNGKPITEYTVEGNLIGKKKK